MVGNRHTEGVEWNDTSSSADASTLPRWSFAVAIGGAEKKRKATDLTRLSFSHQFVTMEQQMLHPADASLLYWKSILVHNLPIPALQNIIIKEYCLF